MPDEREQQLPAIGWAESPGLVPYEAALTAMQARVDEIASGQSGELVWLLEHPPLYTAGTGTKAGDLLEPDRLPVHWTGRGGELTYHGPGQRVVYVMLDLKRRFKGDVRSYVRALEGWIVKALGGLGVQGEVRPGRVGVWVRRGANVEAKIAAIGVRVRRGVSFHGLSVNVSPDLEHYSGIVPCGLTYPVTSLADLGISATMKDVDISLRAEAEKTFGVLEPLPGLVLGDKVAAIAATSST